MTENQLPEGVGKKIVEALKKQSEIEINPTEEKQDEYEIIDNITSNPSSFAEELGIEEDITPEEVLPQQEPLQTVETQQVQPVFEPEMQQPTTEQQQELQFEQPIQFEEQKPETEVEELPQPQFQPEPPQQPVVDSSALEDMNIPANIAVLRRLITQLPSGVTRQTGAQIIRQTMEAMGISMKSVLTEAQQVQENLNNSAGECAASIQEYKRNIASLEQQAVSYKRQSDQLNDLINLFVMTDKR